jgi:serine O-acetyltransferase
MPKEVKVGRRLRLPHGIGVVIHNSTTIGDRVTIFSGVTVGRADAYRKTHTDFEGIRIEDDAVLCTGCKILCKSGILTVAQGSVIGANAVLLNSTKPYEVWVGVPARCVGSRNLEGLPIGEFLG